MELGAPAGLQAIGNPTKGLAGDTADGRTQPRAPTWYTEGGCSPMRCSTK